MSDTRIRFWVAFLVGHWPLVELLESMDVWQRGLSSLGKIQMICQNLKNHCLCLKDKF